MPLEEQTYRRSIDEKLDAILIQTTKTNGRVTTLEIRQQKGERWQSYVIGFCACLTLVITVLTALVASFLSSTHI